MQHLIGLSPRVALASLALFGIFSGCSEQVEKEPNIRPVRAIQVTATTESFFSEYSGNVQARVESRLSFRVSGKIQTRNVDVGSFVKAGQILMQLDLEDLQLVQEQARSSEKAAQSNLELALTELKRFQELRKTDAVSQAALDLKNTAYEAAKANFEQAQAIAKAQSNQATYGTLTSNVDGVVTAIDAEIGQVAIAGIPVIQVAKNDELEIAINIPENSIENIKNSNLIEIHFWANSKDALAGKIREISPVANPATRTFFSKISIINPTPKQIDFLKIGMTASVRFSSTTENSFIQLPLSALYQDKGKTSVWVVEQGTARLVPIQIHGIDGNRVLVTSGLSDDQYVVTAGVHVLNPGQRIVMMPLEGTHPGLDAPYQKKQAIPAPAVAGPPGVNK